MIIHYIEAQCSTKTKIVKKTLKTATSSIGTEWLCKYMSYTERNTRKAYGPFKGLREHLNFVFHKVGQHFWNQDGDFATEKHS